MSTTCCCRRCRDQLFTPTAPYPHWDANWDSCLPRTQEGKQRAKCAPSRHIILIRHGQYDESSREDSKRILTPLGREQAEATGRRLASLVEAGVNIKRIHVSNITRARETAGIITSFLPEAELMPPNPLLNEGRPAHVSPGGRPGKPRMNPKSVARDGPRIETAFRTYFHRSVDFEQSDSALVTLPADGGLAPPTGLQGTAAAAAAGGGSNGRWGWSPGVGSEMKKAHFAVDKSSAHEYEIVVCHANVIRASSPCRHLECSSFLSPCANKESMRET